MKIKFNLGGVCIVVLWKRWFNSDTIIDWPKSLFIDMHTYMLTTQLLHADKVLPDNTVLASDTLFVVEKIKYLIKKL